MNLIRMLEIAQVRVLKPGKRKFILNLSHCIGGLEA